MKLKHFILIVLLTVTTILIAGTMYETTYIQDLIFRDDNLYKIGDATHRAQSIYTLEISDGTNDATPLQAKTAYSWGDHSVEGYVKEGDDCPSLIYLIESTLSEGQHSLSDGTNWGCNKAFMTHLKVVTDSTNWSAELYRNDDYSTSHLLVADGLYCNNNIFLSMAYLDLSSVEKIHFGIYDHAGSDTFDIEFWGYKLK